MFNQSINPPEVFLNEDFIGVWDNVTLDDFNNLVIKTLDESIQVVPGSFGSRSEMSLGFASRYACLGDLDKWAASRLQVACK